jgi:cardiolipin synthase
VIDLVAGHYRWALILFVWPASVTGLVDFSALSSSKRASNLDPIADKLLLSTMFMVLAILHKIAWKYTVLVFSRDISILFASAVLYAIAGLRNFRPSIFGKANTFAQVAAVFFVLLFQIRHDRWVWITQTTFLHATVAFTVVSAVHYVFLVGQRLRGSNHVSSDASKAPGGSI